MPTFIDWHRAGEIPPDVKETIERNIREGRPDENGVIDRGVVLDKDAGRLYCILDAPDEEAVRRHHEAAGIAVEQVHPADAIL